MIRQTIPNLPPIIDVDINLRRSPMQLLQAALKIGKYFTSDLFRIRQAFHQAISRYKRSRLALQKGQLPFLEPVITAKPTLNIALLGHVYTLYDAFSNMNVISKLQRAGVDCVLPDMLDSVLSNAEAATLPKKIFWSPGRQIIGSALYYMKQPHIDGMIYLMNFGCGVDSFVCDLIERRITRSDGLPFMVLTLDEHSGEAGLNTRLEAFIDMINMRKSRALQSGKEII